MAELGQIRSFYNDDPYADFANLSRTQSSQSLAYGDQAARYADPFMGERANYQTRLRNLIANPGSQESSPFFKYLMETQMNQVKANNASRGLSRSGRGAMALQDRAAGVATQSYFPHVAALTQLAQGGASPAAAGIAYERGVRSSQDQAQMAAASKAAGQGAGQQNQPSGPVFGSKAWQDMMYGSSTTAGQSAFGLPYGGAVAPRTTGGGYTTNSNPGTGYIESSGGGRSEFGQGGFHEGGVPMGGTPWQDTGFSEAINQDPYANYDTYADYSDFGYGDYGGE